MKWKIIYIWLWDIKQLAQGHESSSNWLIVINNQICFIQAEFCTCRDMLDMQLCEFSY